MLRLILFTILILILYFILRFLIKDILSSRKRIDERIEHEELVQDPNCQTYIPKRSAVKKKIEGHVFYFCNKRCMKSYFKKIVDK